MPKQYGKSDVKTGEKIDKIVGKTGATTGATRGRMVIKTAYAKALKTHVPDAVQILRQKVITEEPEAKITNARDRLTAPGFYKVTEKVTTETSVQTAIVEGISK